MMSWRRPFIAGASGQVGTALGVALEGVGAEVLRSSRSARPGWLTLDLEQLEGPAEIPQPLREARPDVVLCAGGTTFVDGCEREPEACFRANATGPATLAAFAFESGAPFVFFSSDYVFGGTADRPGPYGESDPTEPLNVYGRSKLAGEEAVLKAHPGALIVRTTVVYGQDAQGKNFLYTLLRHLATGTPLRVPADQISTPTYNRDLAEAVLGLLRQGASGVVHVAGPELMDRLQFAQAVAEFFGLDAGKVQGVSTASLGQTAARPLDSGLKTNRLAELLPSLRLHTVREALAEVEPSLRAFIRSQAENAAATLR